jgi:hypothetical protein
MNANELADYLDNNVEAMLMSEQQHLDQAANMLRQQQAEIEALNQRIERMIEQASHYEAIAHAGGVEAGKELAQAEIDLLKADMRLLLKEYHQYWKEKNDTV